MNMKEDMNMNKGTVAPGSRNQVFAHGKIVPTLFNKSFEQVQVDNSFYDIFLFGGLLFDAFDGGMKFECIDIIQDLNLGEYGQLKAGTQFECVELLFGDKHGAEPLLIFADYPNDGEPDPNTVIRIPLHIIAEHCKW
jgi:hypothetical protein